MELSEAIEKSQIDDVFMCEGPRRLQKGSLALVGHHLIFSPAQKKRLSNEGATTSSVKGDSDLWLLHRAIDRVLVEPFSRDPTQLRQGGYLRLKCKNFMICCFEVDDLEACQAVARSIEKLSNLSGFEHDYPFYYRCPFSPLDNGWTAFSVEEEFSRLQIISGEQWRISAVNTGYETCASYPEMVIVPRGIGDDYLRISATYRDGGRFPVLAYYHAPTKSSLVRCGQPLVGPTGRRCREDETILNSLLSPNSTTKGIIFDTRSKVLATAARGKGGGYESPMHYSQWRYVNGNVPRMRDLHDALAKLIDACNENAPDKFLTRLTSSLWLQHIVDIVTAGATVAQCLHFKEVAVVVHGSEGLDSTLLVTSIAQLCLDADCRTLRGLESLIEREWIQAGHPFSLRCAHSAYASGAITGPQESPVLLAFLDAVRQMTRQYPSCFEFNEGFLVFLFEVFIKVKVAKTFTTQFGFDGLPQNHYCCSFALKCLMLQHAYASEFGSFLGNCEAEKAQWIVKERTISLWSYINHPEVLKTFLNPLYEPYEEPLWPSVAPQSIILWERMYLRWQSDWMEMDNCRRQLGEWKMKERELQSKLLQQQAQQSINCTTSTSTHTTSSSSLLSGAASAAGMS